MKIVISMYLWSVGFIYFGIICIIGILLTFMIPQQKLDPWIKKMVRFLFKLLHTGVEVEGADKIQSGKTYLFMANHVSLFDVPLLQGYIPTFIRGIHSANQFKWPVYGYTIRRFGGIPIDRENIHTSIRSIRKSEKYLKSGRSMIIMPEAHRTLDGFMRPFKKLPFYLAKQAGVELIPIGLSGLFKLKQKGSWHIRPTTLKVKFGDTISSETIKRLSIQELRDLTRDRIKGLIETP